MAAMTGILLLLSFVSCGRAGYQYNNLIDGTVFNHHAGLMFEEEEGVIFFEKTDPILPFQLSRFASIDEMKSYLLGREGVSRQNAVFIDDRPF